MADWQNRIVGHEDVDPKALVPNPANWRTHPKAQRNAMGGALDELGWVQSVIVNKRSGRIVDGHLRVDLAIAENAPTVPVVWVDLSDEEERLALAVIDPIGAMAGKSEDLFRALVTDIHVENDALESILGRKAIFGLTNPDEVPDAPAEPVAKVGDLWLLGDHRLLCGDSTNAEDMAALMDDQRAQMVFTDPPYGVAVASRTGTRGVSSAEARKFGAGISNDEIDIPKLRSFLRASLTLAMEYSRPGAVWYVCAPHGPVGLPFSEVLGELEIWRSSIVWVKNTLVLGRADYHYRHEPIYYGWVPGAAHKALADRSQTSVWEIDRPQRSPEHPTMKPTALVELAVKNSSEDGWAVLDPFSGSGTTIIACEQLGRRCYAMELEPKYVDVAVARWENFSGKKAIKA